MSAEYVVDDSNDLVPSGSIRHVKGETIHGVKARIWLATHYDGRDYYQKRTTVLGLFSSQAKAIERVKALQVRNGEFQGPMGDTGNPDDLFFEVSEYVIDQDLQLTL